MKNYISKGVNISLVTPDTVASGEAILIGNIFGVASADAPIGNNVDLVTEGVFSLPKANVTMPLGCKVYWDSTAKVVTTTVASNTYVGVAVEAVATVALTAPIRLNGFTS
jgi:predicted RecA/RadA family phage recombinase